MRNSLYTFFLINKESFYIYNSLSNSLLEINNESYNILKSAHDKDISENDIDSELYKILKDKRFFVENQYDEFNEYKRVLLNNRNTNDFLSITVAPTMDCNYSCPYCFESAKDIYISHKTIKSIAKFVENQKIISDIRILWFGGEPLLGINEIEELYLRLKSINGKTISSKIITNGYYLNQDNIKILQSINVSSIQISLDGLKETHNKIKYTRDCNDTFSVTIQNIDMISELAPEIQLNIRVNIDKNNMNEYPVLYKYLHDRYRDKSNIYIAPGIVQDFENNTLTGDSKLFSRQEVMEFGINVYKESQIATSLVQYPDNCFKECAIRNKNVFAFDPEGYVYKCWEIIGNKKYAIGKLDSEGNIVDINHILLNRYLYGADPIDDAKCQKCAYLPICNGGCPHHRIENKFNGKNMDTCTHLKGYLSELMSIHLERKEKSSQNNTE